MHTSAFYRLGCIFSRSSWMIPSKSSDAAAVPASPGLDWPPLTTASPADQPYLPLWSSKGFLLNTDVSRGPYLQNKGFCNSGWPRLLHFNFQLKSVETGSREIPYAAHILSVYSEPIISLTSHNFAAECDHNCSNLRKAFAHLQGWTTQQCRSCTSSLEKDKKMWGLRVFYIIWQELKILKRIVRDTHTHWYSLKKYFKVALHNTFLVLQIWLAHY